MSAEYMLRPVAVGSEEVERHRAGHLPPREREVVRLRALGLAYKEVGAVLQIGNTTVHRVLQNAKHRLGVETENEVWMRLGWLEVPDA